VEAGFTLLEAALVLLVVSLLVAGVMPMFALGDEAYQEAWRRQEMLRNARVALDQLAADFARASAVHQATSGTLRFEVVTQTGLQAVEFTLQPGGDLTYRVGNGPAQPLAGPFAALDVRCLDGAGVLVDCSDLPRVRQLELRLEAADPQPDPVRGPVPNLRVTTRLTRRLP
jgi:type II secretory pathway pseudopilin PulG